MHQLVVMGNGFDKSCGLQSGFNDFFARDTTRKTFSAIAGKNCQTPKRCGMLFLKLKKNVAARFGVMSKRLFINL